MRTEAIRNMHRHLVFEDPQISSDKFRKYVSRAHLANLVVSLFRKVTKFAQKVICCSFIRKIGHSQNRPWAGLFTLSLLLTTTSSIARSSQ